MHFLKLQMHLRWGVLHYVWNGIPWSLQISIPNLGQ